MKRLLHVRVVLPSRGGVGGGAGGPTAARSCRLVLWSSVGILT